MRIAVTGSIATDQLMVFPGRFADQLVSGQLDRVSLSFLVDDLEIRRGTLGLTPVLVGAVGPDFAEYGAWLERHHVDIRGVHVSETRHTARFFCTTDAAHNQIASFYAGAMAEAAGIDLTRVGELTGPPDLVVLAPDDPDAMVRHTAQCRDAGFAFAADPSQQLARLDRAATRSLVDGATLLFTNEYEHDLLLKTAEWDEAQVLERVGAWVTTLG